MTTLQVVIPEEVRQKAEEVARQRHMSLDELTTLALVAKLGTYLTDPYLESRASRVDWGKFRQILDGVPDVPPEDRDRIE